MSRVAVITVALCMAFGATATDRPNLAFDGGSVLVRNIRPGGRIAWMAAIRERVSYHTALRIRHGFAPAGLDGVARIDSALAAAPRAIWVVAELGNGAAARGTPPDYQISSLGVRIHATPGGDTIVVESSAIHLLFVHPPAGAWTFASTDGGEKDADGRLDGRITIKLSSLRAMEGNRKTPDEVAKGDVILVIDSELFRSGEVVVQ
jgi:hypothetical protein